MDRVQSMKQYLGRIRDLYGHDKYRFAAANAARMILAQDPTREAEVREALSDIVDLNDLLKGSAPAYPDQLPSEDVMTASIRASMPGIQTQAQFNVTLTAFDVLRTTLNETFLGNKEQAQKNREALLQALDAAEKATEISIKLSQVPEAAMSKEAEAFKNPPAQYSEYDIMKSLMLEVEAVTSMSQLNDWYRESRTRIDRVVTQSYRNTLLDTIRAKKKELASPPSEPAS